MKTQLCVLLLAVLVGCLGAKYPGEVIIFQDDFDTFDLSFWRHELTMSGGGNWEFQVYMNNRTVSYVRDSKLFIRPRLTAEWLGWDAITAGGSLELWGGAPASTCTDNSFYGCSRQSGLEGGRTVINPITSARIRTADTFSFKYGRVEIVAKLPRGDWLWPAAWMLPRYESYGPWPASGEIDIVESRGNIGYPAKYGGGPETYACTVHWGPRTPYNAYQLTHGSFTLPKGDFTEEFHTFGVYWDEKEVYTYVDDPSQKAMTVDMSQKPFWQRALDEGYPWQTFLNPWANGPLNAPFNEEFYLVLNVAVGGTSGYFTDGINGKPWTDGTVDAPKQFWTNLNQWYPTWQGEDAAFQIDSITVYGFPNRTTYTMRGVPHTVPPTASPTATSTTTTSAFLLSFLAPFLGSHANLDVTLASFQGGLIGVLVGAVMMYGWMRRMQHGCGNLDQKV